MAVYVLKRHVSTYEAKMSGWYRQLAVWPLSRVPIHTDRYESLHILRRRHCLPGEQYVPYHGNSSALNVAHNNPFSSLNVDKVEMGFPIPCAKE
jgi:hypothetical protein